MESFFEAGLSKKNEKIGLFNIPFWYYTLAALFIFFLTPLLSYSQEEKIASILEQTPVMVTDFSTGKLEKNQVMLNMDFAGATAKNWQNLKLIKNKIILRVDLVYSRYSSNDTFDQKSLNAKRFDRLELMAPWLFESDLTEWNLVEQVKASSIDEAKRLFHGFIITFRPDASPEVAKEEIDYLKEMTLKIDSLGNSRLSQFEKKIAQVKSGCDLIRYLQFQMNKDDSWRDKRQCGIVQVSFNYLNNGKPDNIKVLKSDDPDLTERVIGILKNCPTWIYGIRETYQKQKTFTIPFNFDCDSNKAYIADYYAADPADKCVQTDKNNIPMDRKTLSGISFPDSTVMNVFRRNPEWKNILLICDLTGSMSGYTAQTLWWLKNNMDEGKVKMVMFFNDGDNKPNANKNIGVVGGLYSTFSTDFETVADLAVKTMKNGQGGDTPENNIEAILEGIKRCPDCEDIVMIADNFAAPRDLALIDEISKHVKVILCGTKGSVNTAYLDFTRKNKGSLHTDKQDVIKLDMLKDKEVIKINKKKYILDGGMFKLVKTF